ncbi:hypothetical protein HDU97_000070 [Phlyctochytrium planicorne]|nr:hypothetical protein HDU97_000070 [Phlyctochytrium planicorne]
MVDDSSKTTEHCSPPALPMEVWADVLAYACKGSISELARLSALSKQIRSSTFHSVSVRTDALIRAFGMDQVLAAIFDGCTAPAANLVPGTPGLTAVAPSSASLVSMASSLVSSIVSSATSSSVAGPLVMPGGPIPMSVFLAQLDAEEEEEGEDSSDEETDSEEEEEDSDDDSDEEMEEDEDDQGLVMNSAASNAGGGGGATLNGHAEEEALSSSSTTTSASASANIFSSIIPSDDSILSTSLSACITSFSTSTSTCPPTVILHPADDSSASSDLLSDSPSVEDAPPTVTPPSPIPTPSQTLRPDPRKWIFAQSPVSPASLVRSLIRRGASITVNDGTPLRVAIEQDRPDLVRALLLTGDNALERAGADDKKCCIGCGNVRIEKAWCVGGKDAVAWREQAALRQACRLGKVDVAKTILECGGDVHVRRDEVLRFAAHIGNAPLVSLLLSYGADPTAMHHASLFNAIDMNHMSIVDLLLSPAPNAEDPHPCRCANAGPGKVDMRAKLNGQGRGFLKNPVMFGNEAMVRLLVEKGVTDNGDAETEAERKGFQGIVDILKAARA